MFDTFYDKNAIIVCKHCGEKNSFKNGVQSKRFECILDDFTVGDVVDTSHITVEDRDWCSKCNKAFHFFFSFKHGIFTGIFPTQKEAERASENFDIVAEYKKVFGAKCVLEQRTHSLESKIKSTIKVHGSEPSTSTFNGLFTYHHNFIDYDIIQTLKNILTGTDYF